MFNSKSHNKVRKICMKTESSIRVRPKCTTTRIDWLVLSQELKESKEKLVQAKKSDLISINHLIDEVKNLEMKLNEIHGKKKHKAKTFEETIITKLRKLIEEKETYYNELKAEIVELQSKLKGLQNVKLREIEKLPGLAETVLTTGTLSDLKAFFDICQKELENNEEISQCKKKTDRVKQIVESYMKTNSFDPLFDSLLSKDLIKQINTSLVEEKNKDNSLNSINVVMPLKIIKTSFTVTKSSHTKSSFPTKLHNRNAFRLKQFNTPFTSNTKNMYKKYITNTTKKPTLHRSFSKTLLQKKGGSSSFEQYKSCIKNVSSMSLRSYSVLKGVNKNSCNVKSTIEELRNDLLSVRETVSVQLKSFSNVIPTIRNVLNFFNKIRGKEACVRMFKRLAKSQMDYAEQKHRKEKTALSSLQFNL